MYDNFSLYKFLEFWFFFKFSNFENSLIIETVKFGKLAYIPNLKCLEYSKMEIHEIFPIEKLTSL